MPLTWAGDIGRRLRAGVNLALAGASGEAGRYRALKRAMEWVELSEEQVRARQLTRLKRILEHARLHVPYWRDLFLATGFDPRDMGDQRDLELLPLLTRNIIREQGDRMLSRAFRRERLIECRTGGSTGEPLRFFITREQFEEQSGISLRANALVGIRPGDPVAKIWGYDAWFVPGNVLAPFTGRLFFDAYRTEPVELDRWIRTMRRHGPHMIYGFTSAVHQLARRLAERDESIPHLRIVSTTGERLLEEQRRQIARACRVPVVDMYGSREVPRIASECLLGRLHQAPDAAVAEFIPAETEGTELVLTSLTSTAMPLIRYRTGDLAHAEPHACDCGLPFPCMGVDVGRVHQVFALPTGRRIHSAFFYGPLGCLDVLRAFQIHHEQVHVVTVRYVPLEGRAEEAALAVERVLRKLRREIGIEVTLRATAMDSIPCDASGQRPAVLSSVAENARAWPSRR